MKVITAKNVNHALSDALWWLKVAGIHAESRNGPVLMAPGPVTTCYMHPTERVLFSQLRDANPYFHLMESVWMLAGHNDVAFPARYAKQIVEYSDGGIILYGAYGHRWRDFYGRDQLRAVIDMLRKDHNTRRAVLAMWDGSRDLWAADAGSLDVPCNTHIYFSAVQARLDMTVCCRSNDAVWGAYGANAVHFSVLQQFIAEAVGLDVGVYYQMSSNLHIYTDRPDVQRVYGVNTEDVLYVPDDRYNFQAVEPQRLLQPQELYEWFLEDAEVFTSDPDGDAEYRTEFFNETIAPMQVSHTAHKAGDLLGALNAASQIRATDWRVACVEWLGRRYGTL
jgi:hypothetical protein